MRYNKDVVLMNAATLTASPSVLYLPVPPECYTALGFIKVGTVSGTSPTLDFTIDRGVRTPVAADIIGTDCSGGNSDYTKYTWIPMYKATQITASTKIQEFEVAALGGSAFSSTQGATLPAPTLFITAVASIGSIWRVTFTVGGTNPSFGAVTAAVQFGGL